MYAMKEVSYIATFVGGLVLCYFLISLGIIDRVDGIPGTENEPVLSLPTYLGFVSALLTAATFAITALGIGIGVVAFFSFRGLKDEVQDSVDRWSRQWEIKLEKALSEVDKRTETALSEGNMKEVVEKIAFSLNAQSRKKTVAELEDGFAGEQEDKEDR